MAGEHALHDQAGQLGLERGGLGYVILDVVGAPTDRGRRVVIGAAGVDADGEAQPFGRRIDRPVGALAQGHVAHDQHQHLDEALIPRAALDLGDRLLHALGRDHDRAAQPLILVEPLLHKPVVQRAAERVLHVLGEYHLHAVERIADAESRAEPVERLLLHVGEV